MPNIHSSYESEDGSSSLEPVPSAPPLDDCNMSEHDKAHAHNEPHAPQHHEQHAPQELGGYTFAEAVSNGHAAKSTIDKVTECTTLYPSDLPPRAPQCSETTQPLTSASLRYNVDCSRANTPSGIMRDMTLNENQQDDIPQGTLHYSADSEIETSHQGVDYNGITDASNETGISLEDGAGITDTTTTAANREETGVGAMLSQYSSQQPQHHQQEQQKQTPGELTTYYSMASQCSLPIHTPTAVAPDNERMRRLSREFLKREDTFERLSFILGRGRLVMVRTVVDC